MRLEEAIEFLRDPVSCVVDLTYEGITERLADLERRDRAKARAVRRAIAPLRRDLFPRSRKGSEHSSYYRALRVRLLAGNPHFQRDIGRVRLFLAVPKWRLSDLKFAEPSLLRLPAHIVKAAHRDTAASWWVSVHRRAACGWSPSADDPPLPEWLIDSATSSARLDTNVPILPDHLRGMVRVPERYAGQVEADVPLFRLAAKLVEHYLLPWPAVVPVAYYILTKAKKHLNGIPEFDMTWDWIDSPLGRALTVTIQPIDEFTTKEQWLSIFERHISPRLSQLWESRGEKPHGRRPAISRFENPLYRRLHRVALRNTLSADKALEELAGTCAHLPDRTTAQDLIEDFEFLFNPERYNPSI